MLRLGYNTNGFNCHSLESALDIIAGLGYRGVAITLDNYILNPGAADLDRQLERTRAILKKKSMACVIEQKSGPRLDHAGQRFFYKDGPGLLQLPVQVDCPRI